ncbi:MAG: hypothetical protein KBT15_05595 [Bacteroidales bacterium]|nr:hypothetical protein [Candidatus Minthousia equi]
MLWGLYKDNTLGDDVKVTIIATGFDKTRDAYMEEELQSQRERFCKADEPVLWHCCA